MRWPAIASIVEGEGDEASLPKLIFRLLPGEQLYVPRPVRVRRYDVIRETRLEHYARIAEASIAERGTSGAVLLLLDADDDCPARLAPQLLARLQTTLPHRRCAVVLATRMYESWLIAGDANLSEPNREYEAVANPKEILKSFFGQYREPVDQPRLTGQFDLALSRSRCRSFDKFCRELDLIAEAIRTS